MSVHSPEGSPRHSLSDAQLAAQIAQEENDKYAAENPGRPSLMAQPGEAAVNAAAGPAIAAANQHRAPAQDRAGQEGVLEEIGQRAWAWIGHATAGIDQFVVDYPVAALVMAVMSAFFGISQILPSFLAALVTGIPLCLFSIKVYQAANARWPEFSLALAAAGGDARAIARLEANQRAQAAGGQQQLQGVVRNGYHPAAPGGMSLLGS